MADREKRTGGERQSRLARVAALWFGVALWKRVLGAMLLGAAAGYALGEDAAALGIVGDIFVRLIRMVVAPLVFVIVASGIASLGDTRRLGRIGGRAIALYLGTMIVAVSLGMAIATLVAPGLGATFDGVAPRAMPPARSVAELFLGIIPLNPIQALAQGDTLAIIFFAIVVGIATVVAGEDGRPLAALLRSAAQVMLRIVGFVMEVAPFGVFALVAVVMGSQGPAALASVFWLAVCVLAGAILQVTLVHGAIVRFLAWLPLAPFYRGIADAMMVGFSTTSSSATLPVAITVAERNLGIRPSISSTVLPLGVSTGMDGTAMYVAMLALFAAQAMGVALGPADYLIVGTTTILIAMGAAPVPSGSLFVLAAVLAAIGIGPAQAALVIGFVLPFDRILDMIRTVPNVTCDLAVATAISRWEGEIDVAVYASAKDV